MEVKKINNQQIIYHCPECEVKYDLPVECEITYPATQSAFKRVESFADAHEQCPDYQYDFSNLGVVHKDYGHPLINHAMKIFEGSTIQMFPDMEGI